MPNLERFIEDIQKRLPGLDFKGKRLALEMLNITVWVDGGAVEITGTMEPENVPVVTTGSSKSAFNCCWLARAFRSRRENFDVL